jgi:hypothetical protein
MIFGMISQRTGSALQKLRGRWLEAGASLKGSGP